MKKRGFGVGKLNGYGGKVAAGESVEDATIRELEEEAGVVASPAHLRKVAELTFIFPSKAEWNQLVHVFLLEEWAGEPTETEEMAPYWFAQDELPFDRMWPDDPHWLPLVLRGERVKARFAFAEDSENSKGFLESDVSTVGKL